MKKIFALMFIALTFQACWECNRVDCAEHDVLRFNIVSTQTAEDLVFGPNAIVDSTGIKVHVIEVGEILEKAITIHKDDFFSFISFIPQPGHSEYFIETVGKTDTLLFHFGPSGNGKCCNFVKLISQFSLNGVMQEYDNNFGIKLIR